MLVYYKTTKEMTDRVNIWQFRHDLRPLQGVFPFQQFYEIRTKNDRIVLMFFDHNN